MGANVFANGREISAKKAGNQSLAAMPDVCLSPPAPPAGPIPIPYPNFSQALDTSSGTKSVFIQGKEAGIKNESNYKQSKGNEAATRNFGMGVISHTIQGKSYHAAWSMNVKFEGSNVIRFGDMTTHNHGSGTNGATTINQGIADLPPVTTKECKELDEKRQQAEKDNLKEPVKPGQTHALGQFDGPGKSQTLGGVSNMGMLLSSTTHAYPSGKQWPMELVDYQNKKGETKQKKQRSKGPVTMACGKNEQPYHGQAMGHAESRIIEHLISTGTSIPIGRVTLSVNHWEQGAAEPDNAPCPSCQKLFCEAEACGLAVVLCDGNQPKKPQCGKKGEFQGFIPV
jgi:hypothetical protein